MMSNRTSPVAAIPALVWLLSGTVAPVAGPPAALSKQEAAIRKAMHGIYSDLKKLRLEFFQLRNIEKAKIYNNEFRYTSGLEHDDKIRGPSFSKYGCDILVHIQYPVTSKDSDKRQLEVWKVISLKNGTSYAIWKLIRTEPTEEGQTFADRVDRVITARLDAMKSEMEGE